MAEVIKMPRMSDTMEEGNIVAWHKNEGDKIEPGDLLAEIETDKATMDFESLWEGHLLHIAVKTGAVPVESIIAVIGEEGEDWKAALESEKATSNGHGETPAVVEEQKVAALIAPLAEVESGSQAATHDTSRIMASPLAKSIAREAGIDLSTVVGTGENGRIVKKDIEAFIGTKPAAAPVSAPMAVEETPAAPAIASFTMEAGESFEEKPLSQMRKVIARRLGESKFTAPHFYLTIEINMDKAVAVRPQLNEISPVKISFNDIVVKACAVALQQHPAVNSSWLGDKIRYNKHINIGVAVAVDEGLLVPVIHHANMKSLSQINQEVRVLAGKAKERKLQPDEMSGNTFTISNLGMFGIEEFTAIINPPDACILAVSSITKKPIVKGDEIVPGNMMKVTLSCDHRVVDGATGAKFLQTVKGILEEPIRLLV